MCASNLRPQGRRTAWPCRPVRFSADGRRPSSLIESDNRRTKKFPTRRTKKLRCWTVQLDGNGALGFTAPDGRALPPEPPREMVDDAVALLRERAADQGLELGAEANLPEWDGHVVDYDWAVGAMIGMG